MIIKKLELQGFKSFPDRTKIVFHPGITAIVGPNGTGKSNLVDAMLWVLGGRRQKTVRGDRTDDILFNGNTKRPPVSMADVILSLGGGDGDIQASHRVFRSGESEYRLDGKTARLKDIQDELWRHSIGEPEYFVIEQGAIGNFVTSKPAEKRTLLEEAAGTAFYKDKKKQAQSKLESSAQNLIRLEDIILEVEKAKNSLQRQAAAATRYRRLRERLRELTGIHYLRKYLRLDHSRQETSLLYNACLEKEQNLLSRLKLEEKDLTQNRKSLWDLEKAVKENQEKVYALKSQAARLESESERETKRIEFFEESKKKAEVGREELKQEILLLELEAVQAKEKMDELRGAFDGLGKDVESASALIWEAKERTADRSREIQSLREQHLGAFQDLTERRNRLIKAEKELELLLRQEEKLKVQASEQQSLLETTHARLARFETEIAGHERAKEERERGVAGLKENLGSAKASIEDLRLRIAALKETRDEAAYQLQTLRKVEEKERSTVSAEDLPGSFGLLADLIRTNADDAALFDVFWKEEAKARVVLPEEFLKFLHPGLKGAYLLIPGQVKSEIPRSILDDPDVAGLLKSRVRTEEHFRGYLSRLEEAVIVRSTETAIRLWLRFPELNYLTASGDILLSSGLLKIGEKGEGMIVLGHEIRDLAEKVAAFDGEIAPLAVTLETLSTEKKALESGLEEALFALHQEERSLQDLAREHHFGRTEGEKIRTTADILSREAETLLQEKNSLSRLIESLNAEAEAAESEERTLHERIESIRKEIAQVLEKDRANERRFFELKAGQDLLQEKMIGLEQQTENSSKRKKALEAKMASLDKEIRRDEAEALRLKDQIQALAEKAAQLESERHLGQMALEENESLLMKVKNGLDSLERKLEASREEEEAAKDERIKVEIRKAEIERDLVNLEETCWQELKKTPSELRTEAQNHAASRQSAAAASGDLATAETDEELLSEEESEEIQSEERGSEEKREEEAGGPGARPRRSLKKLRPVEELTDEDIEKELEDFQDALQKFKAVNLMAEEEFLEQKKRFDFLVQQRQDLRESIHSTQEAIRKIDEESKTRFLKALEDVNKYFGEVFAILFKGGHAEVKLLEPDNPLESGIEIAAQPPGKRVQNLTLLSGGEKSLTSMAFMFALFRYKPSPFCFLDEVDAALDEVNLARFLDLMKAIKHQTQFIIITHNYKTMEVADYIYGTTMEEPNITKIYSVKLERKEELKAAL